MQNKNRTAISGILAGTILEWYDFSLLGSLAPVISTLFFPSKSATLSLMATFGVFATGFIARPIGALIFGHIGDRSGRKQALSLTIFLMALPTTLIGLLPTYNTAGMIAAIMLIILRILQGFAASGEYPGAICMLTEMAPEGKRGFYGSLSMLGVAGGIFLGSTITSLLSSWLSQEQISAWGWRIPFLLGLPLSLIGWYLRSRLHNSTVFDDAQKLRLPIKAVIRQNSMSLFKITMIFALSTSSFYLGFVFMPGYLVNAHLMNLHQTMTSNAVATIALAFLIPVFGYLSDRLNGEKIMLAGIVSLGLLFYPFFSLVTTGSMTALLFSQLTLAFCIAILAGPLAAYTASAFTTSTRYTGTAAALNIGASIIGGTCPLIAAYVLELTSNTSCPCLYPMIFSAISLYITARSPIKAKDHS